MNSGNTTRRAFFAKGGATLGAGVAAAAGAGALTSRPTSASTDTAPDSAETADEAIRRLHQAFIAGVEIGVATPALKSHRAYRSNARQNTDTLQLSDDGMRAQATWNVDVRLGSEIEGDSTVAQMARLQGMLADLRWESGILLARYEKHAGQWRISQLRYRGV